MCTSEDRSPDIEVSQSHQSAGQAQTLTDLKQTICVPTLTFLPRLPSRSWAGIEVFIFEILHKQLSLI